ncbi:hypothetical protein GCM10009850_038060 [Nonomuraea monospora]|uniref:Uncharacterized protein n=1 Tax=Nonomuraea monospora TaxID=568818 RepID=A0ABN3CG56_9ACTN
MTRFTDKTALITGGTSGMGLAAAHRLIAEGAHAIVTGRTRQRVDQATAVLGPHHKVQWQTPTALPPSRFSSVRGGGRVRC